ncbi:hypothetical protein, partial [Bhargavaea beijingensis]|uniref:hypothetical protein n=1 Tax=Bhargavaea beijingensis TaxID=426756 RepID=UPI0022257E9C
PYMPRPQLAMAGGIPYNVVNGVQLKDQLITMAKAESGVSGATEKAVTKGTGKSNLKAQFTKEQLEMKSIFPCTG